MNTFEKSLPEIAEDIISANEHPTKVKVAKKFLAAIERVRNQHDLIEDTNEQEIERLEDCFSADLKAVDEAGENPVKLYLRSDEVAEVTNYPYGRLRTTALFSLEHKSGKGFRTVFQTLNPKTGRWNKEKKSTHHPALLQTDTNGFVETAWCSDFNGEDQMNKGAEFMNTHFLRFTIEQREDIYLHALAMMKVNTHAICRYRGIDFDLLKPLIQPTVDALVKGVKSKGTENTWADVKLDKVAIEALRGTVEQRAAFMSSPPVNIMSMVKK